MSSRFKPNRPRLFKHDVPYSVLMAVGQAIERDYERNKLPVLKWRHKA